jgi:hypothetical protein
MQPHHKKKLFLSSRTRRSTAAEKSSLYTIVVPHLAVGTSYLSTFDWHRQKEIHVHSDLECEIAGHRHATLGAASLVRFNVKVSLMRLSWAYCAEVQRCRTAW